MKLDFTFLKEDQIWGDSALDVMERYGVEAAPTDLAILLGSVADNYYKTSEGDLTCIYWSASPARGVNRDGKRRFVEPQTRRPSVRPVLPYAETSKIKPNRKWTDDKDICHCEFGEYPQKVTDEDVSKKLESLHKSQKLCPTGKKYTFDSVHINDVNKPFKEDTHPEYELEGKRYIRVLGRGSDNYLPSGEDVTDAKPYWVEVQPVEWLMDRSGTWVSKKCLFAGIQFDTKEDRKCDFSKTSMKSYLNNFFSEEMMPLERVDERKNAAENIYGINKGIERIKMKMLRVVAAENVSPEKGVTKCKRSDAEKQVIKAALENMAKGIGK